MSAVRAHEAEQAEVEVVRARMAGRLLAAVLTAGVIGGTAVAGPAFAAKHTIVSAGIVFPEPTGHYGPGTGIIVTIDLSGGKPGSSITITILGAKGPTVIFIPLAVPGLPPIVLGTVVPDAEGVAHLVTTVPSKIDAGYYQVVAQGLSDYSKAKADYNSYKGTATGVYGDTTFKVEPAATSLTSSSASVAHSSYSSASADAIALSNHTATSSDNASVFAGVGAVVVGAGGMFLLTRRRRSTRAA